MGFPEKHRQKSKRFGKLLSDSPATCWICWCVGLVFCSCLLSSFAWGFSAHRRIHEAAIHLVPNPLYAFFKNHEDWIVEHAVDADRRKHNVEGEDVKHYIDLDRYASSADTLNEIFPLSWQDALNRYGEVVVRENGIAIWNIEWTYNRLVESFVNRDVGEILRQATDLGHYISDLHVPLHTTENYNGQLTGQDGIHGLWETQIPEAEMNAYSLVGLGGISPIDVRDWAVQVALASHGMVDSVLDTERLLTASWEGASYAYVERGRVRQRLRSPEYVAEYSRRLNGMVERRMQQSVKSLAGLWWQAWLDAGEPDVFSTVPKVEENQVGNAVWKVFRERWPMFRWKKQ